MAYKINRELEWNQIQITSDSGVSYRIGLNETVYDSKVWIMDLILLSGKPSTSEIYKTMGVIYDVLTEKNGLLERSNITEVVSIIQGNNRDEIDKKTKVFTRWIKKPWKFDVKVNPIIEIQGKSKKIYLNTNVIHMKKNEQVEEKIELISDVKFCFNCGIENKNYKFCPNCGQNLQQA
jgi:hypothetical protein